MGDKDKQKSHTKNIPKDGQVILSIMKEMGASEYDPKTLIQLTEFVYRYSTSVLEEARVYANVKKKSMDLDDVRLALQLSHESTFTTPPSRAVIIECARNKNSTPLPLVKPHCGLRLPPDRHCLAACNYTLKSSLQRKKTNFSGSSMSSGKLITKPGLSYIKKTNPVGITKQAVTIPKPVTKTSSAKTEPQKTTFKPKIQITQNVPISMGSGSSDVVPMEVDNSLKRKREDSESM